MFTTPLSENKSLTNDVDKDTDEFSDMTLMENKCKTKDFDKGTDELADMKQAVVTIHSKGLDQF